MGRDNYRAFFEHIFPLLLRRIFGYDGPSWLSAIAAGDREADAHALTSLLSPHGAHVSRQQGRGSAAGAGVNASEAPLCQDDCIWLGTPLARENMRSGCVLADGDALSLLQGRLTRCRHPD